MNRLLVSTCLTGIFTGGALCPTNAVEPDQNAPYAPTVRVIQKMEVEGSESDDQSAAPATSPENPNATPMEVTPNSGDKMPAPGEKRKQTSEASSDEPALKTQKQSLSGKSPTSVVTTPTPTETTLPNDDSQTSARNTLPKSNKHLLQLSKEEQEEDGPAQKKRKAAPSLSETQIDSLVLQGAKYLTGKNDDDASQWLQNIAYHGASVPKYSAPQPPSQQEEKSSQYEQAVECLSQAAEHGNQSALIVLLRMDIAGWDVKESFNATVVQSCRSAAEKDALLTQYALGLMYALGRGVDRDDAEAVNWYEKAADQGHAGAQCNLGYMYEHGRGVDRDDAEAVKWTRKAAEQGLARAQFNLGIKYQYSRGVDRDDAEAVNWYEKAADQGHAGAQCNLGYMYEHGRGVDRDEAEAVNWCRKAADQGDAQAQCQLGIMYALGHGVDRDDAEAVNWYRKAADQGDAQAQSQLGSMYRQGRGVDRDNAEAVNWTRKAADQGLAQAQCLLGNMYEYGLGVDRDHAEAVKWILMASKNGNSKARKNLPRFFLELPHPTTRQQNETLPSLKDLTRIIEDSEYYLGLYEGLTSASSGQNFKDGIKDDFYPDRLSEAKKDVVNCLSCINDALDSPGYLVSGLIPRDSTNAPSVLSSLQIDGDTYHCVGEENVQLGAQLQKRLGTLHEHKGLKACIDHSKSLMQHFEDHLPDSIQGVKEMQEILQGIETNLTYLVTQLYRKIKEEAPERNQRFMETYFGQ